MASAGQGIQKTAGPGEIVASRAPVKYSFGFHGAKISRGKQYAASSRLRDGVRYNLLSNSGREVRKANRKVVIK